MRKRLFIVATMLAATPALAEKTVLAEPLTSRIQCRQAWAQARDLDLEMYRASKDKSAPQEGYLSLRPFYDYMSFHARAEAIARQRRASCNIWSPRP